MPKTEHTGSTIPRLFGTDGVRGAAGVYPLDPPTVRRLGAALVRALPHGAGATGNGHAPRLLIGRDTRESGTWIEAELAHGAAGERATVTSAGIVPTPAVAYLTRSGGYDAGIVISASHNPFDDNGIKVFSGRGEKFTETVEREVEAIVSDGSWSAAGGQAGSVPQGQPADAYLDHLRAVFPEAAAALDGFKLVIDCANGAATTVAPELFASLGLDAFVIANQPDGRNINHDCGSTHPELLARTVVERGCRYRRGLRWRRRSRDLRGSSRRRHQRRCGAADVCPPVAARRPAARKHGGGHRDEQHRPGDRAAASRASISCAARSATSTSWKKCSRAACRLAASNPVTSSSRTTCTRATACAPSLNVLRTIARTGRTLADLASDLTNFPQVLLNVRVREKVDLAVGAGRGRGHGRRRGARSRPGPPAGPLFGHRAAAARDARRPATIMKSAPGRRKS